MSYYDVGALPSLHALAKNFRICDRWFSSLPGPTWPNRFFALSGSSNGLHVMPASLLTGRMIFEETQPTIFSCLTEAGKSWKIYFNDMPSSMILRKQMGTVARARYFDFSEFESDCAKSPDQFPDFVFIEPKYFGIDRKRRPPSPQRDESSKTDVGGFQCHPKKSGSMGVYSFCYFLRRTRRLL